MILATTAAVFGLMGAALAVGGGWLILLGGSWYYLVAGLAFLVCAWQLLRRDDAALVTYALILLGSLGWAVWEVGFDWWQLAPRGGLLVLLGLWLSLPLVRNGLIDDDDRSNRAPLLLAIAAAVAVAVYAIFQDPHAISGELAAAAAPAPGPAPDATDAGDWPHYGRTLFGQRYSPLGEITSENVGRLEPAWSYRTGDVKRPGDVGETTYQVTPLKVGDTLYVCTPHNWAIALDAATGAEKWKFDANSGMEPDRQHQTCRGVSYWRDAGRAAGAPCAERIYLPTADARLIALDAADGAVCPDFADGGTLQLEAGMPFNPGGYYYSTSPPVAVAGKLIIGGSVNDNYSVESPSGVIRAYDIDTGALVWNWDSGNPDQTTPIDLAAGETYTANSPNSWSVFSADEDLGLVYIPMGNQVPDQLGMGRSANVEKYSSSIVALDIETGADAWVFQAVHHDLWDMDMPAQPVLLDITTEAGATVPALVAPTKQGDVYVLDRRSGTPILPVEERAAPSGAIPEDFSAPTQPTSALSFEPRPLRGRDMWGLTPFDQLACRIGLKRYRYEGRYTPPSLQGSIVYPGNAGVFNWGSVAVDPTRQVMFGMPTYLAFVSQLVPRADIPPKQAGATGSERGLNRNEGAPYGVILGPFNSALGIPCQAPPWGYVAAADLASGEIVYKHRNGTVRDMTPLPLPFEVGVPGIGGPVITAGGVVFLGAAVDDYFRAYDLASGAEIWRVRLPAGGQSTPMTYEANQRQFVVLAAGGHGSLGTTTGDHILAWALPQR